MAEILQNIDFNGNMAVVINILKYFLMGMVQLKGTEATTAKILTTHCCMYVHIYIVHELTIVHELLLNSYFAEIKKKKFFFFTFFHNTVLLVM